MDTRFVNRSDKHVVALAKLVQVQATSDKQAKEP